VLPVLASRAAEIDEGWIVFTRDPTPTPDFEGGDCWVDFLTILDRIAAGTVVTDRSRWRKPGAAPHDRVASGLLAYGATVQLVGRSGSSDDRGGGSMSIRGGMARSLWSVACHAPIERTLTVPRSPSVRCDGWSVGASSGSYRWLP
jgi:hypothetical protein